MPYQMSKASGGDSAKNDAKMERCVSSLVSQGKDKSSAIRICKAAIQRSATERAAR